MTLRLSSVSIGQAREGVQLPSYDRRLLKPRMVHLGIGAFHRAHQAVYTDDVLEEGGDWGSVGVSLRSDGVTRQLSPQDGLFSVAVRDGEERLRVIGSNIAALFAPQSPERVLALMSAETCHVVTLTVTEKGYGLDPSSGKLLVDRGDIASDLAHPHRPTTPIGYIAEALRRRRQAGYRPFTALSCDNLSCNGGKLREAVIQYTQLCEPVLASWIEAEGAFPSTMVDRIVPATTPDDLDTAKAKLGLRDEGFVATEAFTQWVIEDRFCGPRPAWERAGAVFSSEVQRFEAMKLRLLNGPHSAIAYLGCLKELPFVHDVMNDAYLGRYVERLMEDEIAPVVRGPSGFDLSSYTLELRQRFRNPSLQHRTSQIAMDGSQKLPPRLLSTIADNLAARRPFRRLATAVAAWIAYASGSGPAGLDDIDDPIAKQLRTAAEKGGGRTDDLLSAFLDLQSVFGSDLPRSSVFRQSIEEPLKLLLTENWTALRRWTENEEDQR
ncbi:mannitol dehydrogenase family protein [Parvularcula maris]|uniref:Mannitol dehydrogenase family protein n=1 Tax=Parvularcula maris TaxID=2965077 RepID=A0A9X2LAG1_9PROT|nr:mannitol dehydrogenase family protein [Parvularcula maris]MCQ8186096.1 mannitol dehydrogenase family protein [Parvularcula maris]